MALPIQTESAIGRQFVGLVARDAYERWLDSQIAAILDGAFREIVRRLVVDYHGLTASDRLRLRALFTEVSQRLEAAYGQVSSLASSQLQGYSQVESDAAAYEMRTLLGSFGDDAVRAAAALSQFPSASLLQSIAQLPIQGLTIGEWWEAQARSMTQATKREIQAGLVLGESPRDVARRIIPDRGSAEPAVWRRARAQALAITRTTMTAVYNDAALRTYEEAGRDAISDSYVFTAVRDSRTTEICIAHDGKVYRYDDPKRAVPPLHIRCRSTCVPVIADEVYRAAGREPPPVAKAGRQAFQSYASWYSKQPKSMQDAILGRTRAQWFRDGKLSLHQLVDTDRRLLTLEQLRARIAPRVAVR